MKENSSPYIASSSKPTRERVGLILDGANSAAAVKTIVATETAGVRQVWMVQSPFWPDVLTTLSAATTTTTRSSIQAKKRWLCYAAVSTSV